MFFSLEICMVGVILFAVKQIWNVGNKDEEEVEA